MGTVLLTRRIPSSVLTHLQSQHTVDLYTGEGAIPREELLRRIETRYAAAPHTTAEITAEQLAEWAESFERPDDAERSLFDD